MSQKEGAGLKAARAATSDAAEASWLSGLKLTHSVDTHAHANTVWPAPHTKDSPHLFQCTCTLTHTQKGFAFAVLFREFESSAKPDTPAQ